MKTHEKLRAMRKEAKLSRRELAEISGFNEHTILAYERNQNPPSNDYVKFCALYFGYELSSIQDSAKELEKMSENEQVLGIYKEIENCDFNGILENCDINTNDYTPSKYAEFVKLQSIMAKLEKSKQYAKQDLELLALLNSLNAEIKDSLKALIKSIIAKGATK
ncbi:MAG: helix-turn-helix domain-containing protein [Campylobacter sp.]|uniref:helix-turn-helix domain-containing protein n=1 Tax=Campylobacter sp. TaxID=205 RepID=UPI002AA69DE3|nr:helix-turn-helix transcriptional regulator [Campylobacter sp.]MCI7075982.1 helix-turn-helix domain-containing protein [Campylobacter sp.]MCI7102880.1 helix-turn-helix domain-containing protein [Campylobacter sp.]MCI7550649.1 helix-turn-helix domain-containing protein [Campylobacter sp.]